MPDNRGSYSYSPISHSVWWLCLHCALRRHLRTGTLAPSSSVHQRAPPLCRRRHRHRRCVHLSPGLALRTWRPKSIRVCVSELLGRELEVIEEGSESGGERRFWKFSW